MITAIAALYVILPALFALACCALAMMPKRFEVAADEPQTQANAIYAMVRDECARKAIDALHMATRQSTATARQVWLDVALVYKRRAEAYNQGASCC